MRHIAWIALGVLFAASAVAAQDKAVIERGQKVYTAQKCQTCHSIDGKGNKKGPLEEVGSKLGAEEVRQWLVNAEEMTKKTNATRKPVMKSFSKLPKEDIDALVAYLESLTKS